MKTFYNIFLSILLAKSIDAQQTIRFTLYTDKAVAKVAPTMWSKFFEDINRGAEGGLYAELIKNRSFEFARPFMGWKKLQSQTATALNPYYDFIQSDFFIINRQDENIYNPRFIGLKIHSKSTDSIGSKNDGLILTVAK